MLLSPQKHLMILVPSFICIYRPTLYISPLFCVNKTQPLWMASVNSLAHWLLVPFSQCKALQEEREVRICISQLCPCIIDISQPCPSTGGTTPVQKPSPYTLVCVCRVYFVFLCNPAFISSFLSVSLKLSSLSLLKSFSCNPAFSFVSGVLVKKSTELQEEKSQKSQEP